MNNMTDLKITELNNSMSSVFPPVIDAELQMHFRFCRSLTKATTII